MVTATVACAKKPARAPIADEPPPEWLTPPPSLVDSCAAWERERRAMQERVVCGAFTREVSAWGAPPRDGPPSSFCPVRVRVAGERLVAEAGGWGTYDALPFEECPPAEYWARHALEVEDGWLVAYEGAFYSHIVWTSKDGAERKLVSAARIAGFVRAPSGAILGLAIARVRLGRGAVVRFERTGPGDWALRLVSILLLEPSSAVYDDGGVLVGFAKGFVFRADEHGRIENVAYIPQDLGRIASIARSGTAYYLGLECGVLKLLPDEHRQEWWSARHGASGRWDPCHDRLP